MKKRILTTTIAIILVAFVVCSSVLFVTPKPAVAEAASLSFLLFVEDINHLNKAQHLITNKQAGIYFFECSPQYKVLLKSSAGKNTYHKIVNSIVLIPAINNVKYEIHIDSGFLSISLNTGCTVTYDLEKPRITASNPRESFDNNSIVIGKAVTINAYDNFQNLKLYVSKDGGEEKLCDSISYEIIEDGTYTFYAVDIAGNYSDDFTITHYKQEPVKEPDEPVIPDDPIVSDESITPTSPITPDKPINENNNTILQGEWLIAIVVIISIVIGVIVGVIVYRKMKAKTVTAHFNEDE